MSEVTRILNLLASALGDLDSAHRRISAAYDEAQQNGMFLTQQQIGELENVLTAAELHINGVFYDVEARYPEG